MTEQPTTPQTDEFAEVPDQDSEGHILRFGSALPQEPTEDDTEGHSFYSDRDLKGDIAEVPGKDSDDIEGHSFYSDRDLKGDIAEVPDDDTEGHGFRVPGAVAQEPTEDDTEGHVQPPRGDDTDHLHS